MKRSSVYPMPEYYKRYINLVEDIDIIDAMKHYDAGLFRKEQSKLVALEDRIYADGKWTIKDILQHMIDTERVMSYRALRLARHDKTHLPGFDQDAYVDFAGASRRKVEDLLNEFEIVRRSSLSLFETFTDEEQMRTGICSDNEISVLGLGFVITGHPVHHFNIIRERYFPLLSLER